jgi:hypothetical protein
LVCHSRAALGALGAVSGAFLPVFDELLVLLLVLLLEVPAPSPFGRRKLCCLLHVRQRTRFGVPATIATTR